MAIRQSRYLIIGEAGGNTDGSQYQLKSNISQYYEETSTTKYPSSKALSDGLATKQDSLTTAQQNAVDSGITAAKVTTYDGYATGKQDKLTAGEGITIQNNVISATGGAGGGGSLNLKSALMVQVSYNNNDVVKGAAVVVDGTTINTKNNGLAIFTGLSSGNKTITASKDGYLTASQTKQVENPVETKDVELQPVTLTFTTKDTASCPVANVQVKVDKYAVTDNQEQTGTVYNAYKPETGETYYMPDTLPSTLYRCNNSMLLPLNPQPEFSINNQGLVNATAIGAVTVNDGVCSGFGSSDYIKLNSFNFSQDNWEIKMKITTGANVSSEQVFFHACFGTGNSGRYGIGVEINSSKHFGFFCSATSSSWLFNKSGSYTVQANTTYFVKVSFDGSQYKLQYSLDDQTYIDDITHTSTSNIYAQTPNVFVGIYSSTSMTNAFKGSIDLTEMSITIGNTTINNFFNAVDSITVGNTEYIKTPSENLVEYKTNTQTVTVYTNNEGTAQITAITDGKYKYTTSKELFDTATGQIAINRAAESENIVMLTAPIICYAAEAVVENEQVKINAGVGDSDTDYNVYAANTATTNELTLDGLARSSAAAGETAGVRITNYNETEITVETPEDNADIQFNNDNDICTVNITANMQETHNWLAFKKTDDSVIYFKDRTYPFVPSDNTYPSTSFTYYTYENNAMVEHTATTQSATSGDTTYDGTTLTIHSQIVAVDGVWQRQTELDQAITTELDGATITTSSYLTTPQAIIPRENYWRFAMEKLNPTQWQLLKLIIGGSAASGSAASGSAASGSATNLANLQEIIVPNNTVIEMYLTKAGQQNPTIPLNAFRKVLTITNDYIYRKVKFGINLTGTATGATITLKVNNVEFNVNSNETLDVYAGETVYYTVEKEGYVTQTGSYKISQYPTEKEHIQAISSLTENNN